jgi:hypothetical protein
VERLGNVIIRPNLQADDAVHHVAAAREHDDAHIRARPDLLGELDPILTGQDEVEEHKVDPRPIQAGAHSGSVLGGADAEALTFEVAGQHLPDAGVVIDHKDMRLVSHGPVQLSKLVARLCNKKPALRPRFPWNTAHWLQC